MPFTVNNVEIQYDNIGGIYAYYSSVVEHNEENLDDEPGNQVERFIIKIMKDLWDSMSEPEREVWAIAQTIAIKDQRQAEIDRENAINELLANPEYSTDGDGYRVYKRSWLQQLENLGYDIKQLPEAS